MKKILLAASLLVFGMAGMANAVPVTWEDTIDWNKDVYLYDARSNWYEYADSLHYSHNIADQGFSSKLTGGNDTITSFSLQVKLYDDSDVKKESAKIYVPIWPLGYAYDFNVPSNTFAGNYAGKIDLLHDGILHVSIEPIKGDFYADWSKLTVYGDDGNNPVPEPASIILLGLGLAGFIGYSRKASGKKHKK